MALIIPLIGYFQRKNIFSGAHSGMRYSIKRIEKILQNDGGEETKKLLLELIVWPEPWALERTDPALHEKSTYEASQEGCDELVKALQEMYEQNKEQWDNCPGLLDCEPWYAPPQIDEENEEQSK